MAQISFGSRQVSCKIVYYGPGLSGKTTNIEVVHQKVPGQHRGELTSIATEGDRTLFFDFMPLDLGSVAGMQTKFQLYTVPGQVYYNATRKLVLQGADGVVFVADSSPDQMTPNLESMANLRENLAEQGVTLEDVPLIIQYNKRDLPNAVSIALLESRLNPRRVPSFEAIAATGEGVLPTLKALSKLVLDRLNERYGARAISASSASTRVSEVPRPARQPSVAVAAGQPREPALTASTRSPGAAQRLAAQLASDRASGAAQPPRAAAPRPASVRTTSTSTQPPAAKRQPEIAWASGYSNKRKGKRAALLLIGIVVAAAALAAVMWFFA